MAVMAGIDFFTVEVLTWRGLVPYYIPFFIHLESRRVCLTRSRGIRTGPSLDGADGPQRDRRELELGYLNERRYALHDRDTKFCALFRDTRIGRDQTHSTAGVEAEPVIWPHAYKSTLRRVSPLATQIPSGNSHLPQKQCHKKSKLRTPKNHYAKPHREGLSIASSRELRVALSFDAEVVKRAGAAAGRRPVR
jgi:hypothetical protein